MKPGELGSRARQHIKHITETIGPRPAGSTSERQAQDYIAGHLDGWGYEIEWQPVPFAPLPRFAPIYPLAGLLLVGAGWVVPAIPWLALLLPVLGGLLPQAARYFFQRRPHTCTSQNLIASRGEATLPQLILCAHVDSARAFAFQNRSLLWLQGYKLFLFQRAAILLAILAVFQLAGLIVPTVIFWLAGFLATLAGLWMFISESNNQLFHRNRYSPGAIDNASGVGVLLALAEHFSNLPASKGYRLRFLFTGAEETGMHGALAMAQELVRADVQAHVLCLDMVGAGASLRIVTKDGSIFPIRTDNSLNTQLFRLAPDASPLWYTDRSGDHFPFLQNGIPATSIQTSGRLRAERAYHTIYDRNNLVERATLQRVAELVLEFTKGFDPARM
ncbi:MAG: Zn-dependent exopeptidase M28 [Chloroflexi bacterium]|nr:MAG: Zn-dependent exopeptidase M28 [Chloroflexota bacterium]MBL1194799.1 Zn-dependent exopeptidase M28 [Chloroflexota bacterium]NOH12091.1 M20/M25/M40 family metallo-hydrolase [Chloroflexota bacterium]